MKITIKELEKAEVEILGIIESSEFGKHEEKALSVIGKRLELPGFRKGKAPISKVKENTPEMELLEEMAEMAINEAYPKILEENKIDAIGRPNISITKIGKGSDLEFKIITAILPEMKLPDYKKIAKDQNNKDNLKKEIIIEEADVEKTILELRKMRAEQSSLKDKKEKDDKSSKDEKKKDEQKDKKTIDKPKEIPESEYPKFDDDFAKSFGNFKSADEFREKIKSNLKIEKETEQKDKLRLSMMEEIIKSTEGEIPEILIKSETDKILYRLQADIANMGFKFEDYLKQINKTEEDLRKEWKDDAEKRAKLQMIIQAISEKENLKPTEEEIKKDVDNVIKMFSNAPNKAISAYAKSRLTDQKEINI